MFDPASDDSGPDLMSTITAKDGRQSTASESRAVFNPFSEIVDDETADTALVEQSKNGDVPRSRS
jgi:hypothetical protein